MALKMQPDGALLLALLIIELRKCKALAPAYVIYASAPEDSETRSFKCLTTPLDKKCYASNGRPHGMAC